MRSRTHRHNPFSKILHHYLTILDTDSTEAYGWDVTLTINSKPRRKTYAWGATRMRGKTELILQPKLCIERGEVRGYYSRRGKTLTEWVRRGGPRDHSVEGWKPV